MNPVMSPVQAILAMISLGQARCIPCSPALLKSLTGKQVTGALITAGVGTFLSCRAFTRLQSQCLCGQGRPLDAGRDFRERGLAGGGSVIGEGREAAVVARP